MAALSHHRAEPVGGSRFGTKAAFVLATAILLDEGVAYADLSVEQIARKAGRSRSTFYFHFRDKRELLLHAIEEFADRLYASAADWLKGPGDDGEVREAIDRMYSIYCQHPGLLGAVVESSGYDDHVRERWRDLMGRFVSATEQRLRQEHVPADGMPFAESAQARAFALVWMMERACYQQLTGGGVRDEDALIDALADIWNGSVESMRAASEPAHHMAGADSGAHVPGASNGNAADARRASADRPQHSESEPVLPATLTEREHSSLNAVLDLELHHDARDVAADRG